MDQQQSLLDQILSGQNRNLQVLAAQGLVPLAPEDLIPIQIALTGSPDGEISNHAATALRGIEASVAVAFVREKAGARELRWFGLATELPEVAEAVIRRPDVPREVLEEMAPRLSEDLQEVLVHRQDAILDLPRILLALETNPRLTGYVRRRIWEYREHLLPREALPAKKMDEVQAEA
ncbi:MAG: hypothetical protein MI919_07400, partial [Holophagales bacterium]|nr:hypothetical protein [Holophagales bacterium]